MYSLKVSGRGLKLKKESKTQKEKTTWRVGNIKKNSKVFENFFLKHAKKQKKKKLSVKKKAINYLVILLGCILNLEYSYKQCLKF